MHETLITKEEMLLTEDLGSHYKICQMIEILIMINTFHMVIYSK